MTDKAVDGASSAIALTGALTATTVTLTASNSTHGSITIGSNITTSATSGAVSLISTGQGGITESAGLIQAKTLTVSSGAGGANLGTANVAATLTVNSAGSATVLDNASAIALGASSAGQAFSLSDANTSGNITVGSTLTGESVTLIANSGTTNNITVNGTVSGIGEGSNVTMTASGNVTGVGTRITGYGPLSITAGGTVGTKTVPLGAAVSSVSGSAGVGGFNLANTITGAMHVSVTTSGNLTVTNLGSLTGSATSTAAGAGLGAIVLKTSGASASIGAAGTAFQTTTPATGSLTLSTAGTGLVNVSNSSTALTLNTSSSGGSFALATNGTMTLSGVSSHALSTSLGGGNINLSSNGTMNVNGNVTASGGSVILQDASTTGGINVKAGAQVTTLITGKNIALAQAEVVLSLGTGAIPTTGTNFSTTPSITVSLSGTPTAGQVLLGTGTLSSTVLGPTPGKATIQAIGSLLLLNNSNCPGCTINLGSSSLLKADPVTPGLIAPVHLSQPQAVGNTSNGVAAGRTTSPSQSLPNSASASSATQTVSFANGSTNAFALNNNSASQSVNSQTVSNTNAQSVLESLASKLPAFRGETGLDNSNFVLFDGSNIRGTKASLNTVGHGSSSLRPVSLETTMVDSKSKVATTNMSGAFSAVGVDASVGNDRKVTLRKGSMLLVPQQKTIVETGFGTLTVDAQSVVLVVATQDAVSVYNFHDSHAGAVSATVGGSELSLLPGHHLTVSTRNDGFEKVNPLAALSHRSLETASASGLYTYSSEFSIMSALTGLKSWTEMKQSKNSRDVRLVNTVLKNAVIIMQTRANSGGYQLYRSQLEKVAMAR